MKMTKLEYKVRFVTPAFLGNAKQSGQWRTPPFKALLRHWWRVAYAADRRYNVKTTDMRQEEGVLFGNAWLSHQVGDSSVTDYSKSLLRMRLDKWSEGNDTKARWGNQESDAKSKIQHPEVQMPIGPLLYLGYGPLSAAKTASGFATVLKNNAAIQAGEEATLSLAVPSEYEPRLLEALWLIDRFGTIGGRSRNGWGALSLTPHRDTPALTGSVSAFSRPWKDALNLDWPHSIGMDPVQGPLTWRTRPFQDWKSVMRELAIIRVGLRTQFEFTAGKDARFPESRHWLSYPVTKHKVASWRDQGDFRLPNSLRFKVSRDPDDSGLLRGLVFHVPCSPPSFFRPDRSGIEVTWRNVHGFLDELTQPEGSRRFEMIVSSGRRERLKDSLAGVTVERVKEPLL